MGANDNNGQHLTAKTVTDEQITRLHSEGILNRDDAWNAKYNWHSIGLPVRARVAEILNERAALAVAQ